MKGSSKLFAAAVIAAICSCHTPDSNFFPASSRQETQRGQNESERDSVLVPPHRTPVSVADTEIVCTAVRFPDSYDWRNDQSGTPASFEILLYRNGKVSMVIEGDRESEMCPDPDMHHLVGSQIFTEYSSMTRTTVTNGGYVVADFEGREMLKGIFFDDGDVYTLSTGRDGYGFSYRKNGEIILKKDHRVHVYGSLGNPSYPETGALYEVEGNHLVFCYRESNAHFDYHVVTDGVDRVVELKEASKILDMKVIEDSVHFVGEKAYDAVWEDASIPFTAPDLIVGCVDGNSVVYDKITGEFTMLCGRDAVVYTNGSLAAALYHPTRGKCSIYYSNGECRFHKDACCFFTRRCAAFAGDNLMVAINPLDKSQKPYLSTGDRKYELEGLGNGYISGFRVTISQSN